MNLPNILTVARFLLTLAFLFLSQRLEVWAIYWAAGMFTLGALTDFLDGYIARKYQLFTDFGKLMDPIADKFLVLSAFFIFMQKGYFPPWMFYVIVVREVSVTVSRLCLMKSGKVIAAEFAGKAKTVLQMITIFAMLIMNLLMFSTYDMSSWVFKKTTADFFFIVTQLLMILTVTLTVHSGLKYFWNNRQNFKA
ncbi:MAG: CDP-diacylglycerol--glycerol-3-phosphate 3-phosphatidyltransferase [Candidatus Omnitrophica bacterium]|nr:CDP-diacylglycerol--glycerol-3-phosphate 3-phosphatidyltransferase [Candidatus Omnitrophota bacterium]